MILYHTGTLELKKPDIHYGRKNADFGQGFYLTPDSEFALSWSSERKNIFNTYQFELSGLRVHRFLRSKEWMSYIFSNRRGRVDYLDADVVIGPIANDTIFDTLGIINSGFLTDEQALQLLLLGPEFIQVALKTEKAAQQLVWKSAREIPKEEIARHREPVKMQESEYLQAVGYTIEKF